MLHKISLLMTGLTLMMAAGWFALHQINQPTITPRPELAVGSEVAPEPAVEVRILAASARPPEDEASETPASSTPTETPSLPQTAAKPQPDSPAKPPAKSKPTSIKDLLDDIEG